MSRRCLKLQPQVHGIVVASNRQAWVVFIGNLLSTTRTSLPTQCRQNNLSCRKLKINCFDLLTINELEKSIYDRNLRLGITTLSCQMIHELQQANLFTQAIEVEGLQIKSIYAFSQRSIDWQIKPNYLFSWNQNYQSHKVG